jgi:CheY-like chemotaxis protein
MRHESCFGAVVAERRILVTDDEALFRSSVAESLRARFERVDILEASDGEQARSLLAKHRVDLLITDLQMPKLGGLELIAHVSSQRLPVQVIVVSAHINEKMRSTLDRLGALTCIDKPIDLAFLHRAVQLMLEVPRAHVSGVTLASFLQLVEMERQSCAIRVCSPDGIGTLVFERGSLIDAWSEGAVGDDAALKILRFSQCTLDSMGVLERSGPRMTAPLSYLLLEAARLADEEGTPLSSQWDLLSLVPPATVRHHKSGAEELSPQENGPASPAILGKRNKRMADINKSIEKALSIGGCIGAALVDYESGMCLGYAGNPGFDLELAAAGNTEVVRAKKTIRDKLGLKDAIEDILISLSTQYHLIRMVGTTMFIYVALDRSKSNLALARKELESIERGLEITRD